MTKERIPHAWVGKEVEVGLAVPAGFEPAEPYTLHPLAGEYKIGVLENVNEHGIVGAFSGTHDEIVTPGHQPTSTFYPWSAVLSIQPFDEKVAEVRPIR